MIITTIGMIFFVNLEKNIPVKAYELQINLLQLFLPAPRHSYFYSVDLQESAWIPEVCRKSLSWKFLPENRPKKLSQNYVFLFVPNLEALQELCKIYWGLTVQKHANLVDLWNIEVWAVQKHANIVDLVKSFQTRIYYLVANVASIKARTSLLKFI